MVSGEYEERPDHGAAVEAFAKHALHEDQVGRSETRHNDPNHAVESVAENRAPHALDVILSFNR